jgi:hypothetical protein
MRHDERSEAIDQGRAACQRAVHFREDHPGRRRLVTTPVIPVGRSPSSRCRDDPAATLAPGRFTTCEAWPRNRSAIGFDGAVVLT